MACVSPTKLVWWVDMGGVPTGRFWLPHLVAQKVNN